MRRGFITKELFSANSNINVFNRSTQTRPTKTNENENRDEIFSQSCRLVTRRRKYYTALFKLKVIEYAKANGNSEAARHFSVSESSVREWLKCKPVLLKLPNWKAVYESGCLLAFTNTQAQGTCSGLLMLKSVAGIVRRGHRGQMSASKTDFEKHSTRQEKKKPAMRKMNKRG
ncbi:hypothetical protein HZS_2904 [Henneguya salminicola]|nr:hypothetical protein HZS_2904 [Henneguya salminicola]